jgi:hypothetical protein
MGNEKSLLLQRASARPSDEGRLEARKTLENEESSMFGSAVLVECSTGNTLGIFAKFCVWAAAI